MKNTIEINGAIAAKTLRVIDGEENLGLMEKRDALKLAEEKNLDLILIVPNANPPVAKIYSYSKYKYELQKKQKQQKKNNKIIELKQLNVRPNIGENDLNIKKKAAIKFFQEGDRVIFKMRFKKRELLDEKFVKKSMEFLQNVGDSLNQFGKVEAPTKLDGMTASVVLASIIKTKS